MHADGAGTNVLRHSEQRRTGAHSPSSPWRPTSRPPPRERIKLRPRRPPLTRPCGSRSDREVDHRNVAAKARRGRSSDSSTLISVRKRRGIDGSKAVNPRAKVHDTCLAGHVLATLRLAEYEVNATGRARRAPLDTAPPSPARKCARLANRAPRAFHRRSACGWKASRNNRAIWITYAPVALRLVKPVNGYAHQADCRILRCGFSAARAKRRGWRRSSSFRSVPVGRRDAVLTGEHERRVDSGTPSAAIMLAAAS